jgi:hypothetical protein
MIETEVEAAGAGLILVAGLPMVSPTPKPELTDELWSDLLLIQAGDGVDTDDVAAFITRAEAHMGTTDMHRIDAKVAAGMMTSDEAEGARRSIRSRISAEKRRQMLDGSRQAACVGSSLRAPDFVDAIASAEGKLQAAQKELEQLQGGNLKKNRKEIRRVENRVRGLAEKLAGIKGQEQLTYDILGEARDPLLRAIARGQTMQAREAETAEVKRDRFGAKVIHRRGEKRGQAVFKYDRAVRIKNLTGIEHALHSGHLRAIRGAMAEEHLVRIGEEYGAAYEIIEGLASRAGEGGGGFKPKAPLPRAIEAGETLADMRKGLNARQRKVLDLVCGESLRAREAATAMGAGFPATVRALVGGLKAAETSRLAERERREQNGAVPIGARVQMANAMLRGVRA